MPKPVEYPRKDGGTSWRVRFRHAGKETSETFDTQRAAEIFCQDIANRGADYAVNMREVEDRDRRGKTLDEALDAYLEWKSARVRSDRTIKDYRRRYELAIKPMLGHRHLAGLTAEDIADWVDAVITGKTGARTLVDRDPDTGRKTKRTQPLSAKSLADRHALLHSVIKYALGKKWIEADPCADTELPTRHKKPPKGLRPGEWQALHAALSQIDPDAADLALFLISTGWRFGEATALSTHDVDDDGVVVKVWVTQVMRRDAVGRTHIVQDAKSDAGYGRHAALDPVAADMIRRRVSRARPGDLVFTTKTGAAWHHSHFRSRAWQPSVALANLNRRPTPHWLRHTHVGWMIMSGAALPELQVRIGHKSIKTTVDLYGSMVIDVQQQALDAFAAMRGSVPQVAPAPIPLTLEQ